MKSSLQLDLQRRAAIITSYWKTVEEDLIGGEVEYVIPRAIFGDDNGFVIGNVSYMILFWETHFLEMEKLEELDEPFVAAYQRVSSKIQPMVDFWNTLVESSTTRGVGAVKVAAVEEPLPSLSGMERKQLPRDGQNHPHHHTMMNPSPLVEHMVNLLEAMNYETKTGRNTGIKTRRSLINGTTLFAAKKKLLHHTANKPGRLWYR